jgi:DNA-binding GntR family transcriptional regulator
MKRALPLADPEVFVTTTPPPASQFAPVKRPLNLRESVLEQLRTAIVTGELAEGELVSAPSLGQALGVSATPVREAMMDLVREGLVETVKNKGFRITGLSEKDLDDLAQIRLMLEPPAMHLVIGNISDAEYAELTELADACLRAAELEDLGEYLRYDRDFHALLLTHTGNPQLAELATTLRRRTRLYGIALLAKQGRLDDSAREHHELLRVLRDGDGAAAAQLLHTHIGHSRDTWATGDGTQLDGAKLDGAQLDGTTPSS